MELLYYQVTITRHTFAGCFKVDSLQVFCFL